LELEAPWKAKKRKKQEKANRQKRRNLRNSAYKLDKNYGLLEKILKMYDGYIVVKDAQTNSFRIHDKYSNVSAGKAKFA
jgi:hypothetical protein